ncbi:MAG: energy-coupling factor transporter transmembrane protein EcfT [Alicyclobacillus sp.]|nr:energy-coupling factor transporter transmembrane protein EcfT [Alicyclobacillus sp.]
MGLSPVGSEHGEGLMSGWSGRHRYRRKARETHPVTWLVAMAAWVWAVYRLQSLSALAAYAALGVGLQALLNRDPLGRRVLMRALSAAFAAAAMVALFALVSALFADGGRVWWRGPHIPGLGTLQLTSSGVALGLSRALRIWGLLLGVAAWASHVRPDDVTVWLGRRFARAGLTLAMIFTFLPTVRREYQRLGEYVRTRTGLDAIRSRRARLRAMGVILQALLANALERSWILAESMYVRGYSAQGRSRYRQTRWSAVDAVFAGALAAALAAALTAALVARSSSAGGVAEHPTVQGAVSVFLWCILCGLGVVARVGGRDA